MLLAERRSAFPNMPAASCFPREKRHQSANYIFLQTIILALKQQHDADILLTLYDYFYIYQFIGEVIINIY
jgi:hypothetical protein